jgi:hypothetical protein
MQAASNIRGHAGHHPVRAHDRRKCPETARLGAIARPPPGVAVRNMPMGDAPTRKPNANCYF